MPSIISTVDPLAWLASIDGAHVSVKLEQFKVETLKRKEGESNESTSVPVPTTELLAVEEHAERPSLAEGETEATKTAASPITVTERDGEIAFETCTELRTHSEYDIVSDTEEKQNPAVNSSLRVSPTPTETRETTVLADTQAVASHPVRPTRAPPL
eukprot:2491170-Rhodomonas_salina.1